MGMIRTTTRGFPCTNRPWVCSRALVASSMDGNSTNAWNFILPSVKWRMLSTLCHPTHGRFMSLITKPQTQWTQHVLRINGSWQYRSKYGTEVVHSDCFCQVLDVEHAGRFASLIILHGLFLAQRYKSTRRLITHPAESLRLNIIPAASMRTDSSALAVVSESLVS